MVLCGVVLWVSDQIYSRARVFNLGLQDFRLINVGSRGLALTRDEMRRFKFRIAEGHDCM